MNIHESYKRLWNILGQIPLNRDDRSTVDSDLGLLYEEARKANEQLHPIRPDSKGS